MVKDLEVEDGKDGTAVGVQAFPDLGFSPGFLQKEYRLALEAEAQLALNPLVGHLPAHPWGPGSSIFRNLVEVRSRGQAFFRTCTSVDSSQCCAAYL